MGYPVEHSLSPRMHNAALKAQGLNIIYTGLNVSPSLLPEAVAGLRALNFLGANVTIPHKEAVIPLLDEISERARAVGAVNTIVVRKGRLYGDNTDVAGFRGPLASHAEALKGTNMVVLGAGGAARAAVYALLKTQSPHTLTVVARRRAPAEKLARDMASYGSVKICGFDAGVGVLQEAALIVNATPAGMYPHSDDTPWSDVTVFHRHQLIYDLVYRPRTTRLMREAAARGAQTLGGLPMLIGQAAAAYRQWTGRVMPLEVVEAAVERTH